MKKRGQVTAFVIAGVIIVVAIVLFFLFRQGMIPGIGEKPEENPVLFLETCIEDKLIEGVELISSQGGYVKNKLNRTFKFDGEEVSDISYLCYNQNYYVPCINQEPMLVNNLKSEIDGYISDEVRECFDKLALSLDKRGYVVDVRYSGFEIELAEKKIIVDIDGEIILTKSGETTKHENFNLFIPSRFYDLAVVVQEIISQEARFCNFETLGYMLLYPEFRIDKFRTGDGDTLYTLQHKGTQEKFKFAVRSCVIPPGF